MMQSLSLKSTDELLQRIGAQSSGSLWTILIANTSDLNDILNELGETITIFSECEAKVISAQSGASDLASEIMNSSEEFVLLGNFEDWRCEDWHQFDAARSQLSKPTPHGGILLLSDTSAKLVLNCAPNFCSWVGSRFYALNKDSEFLTSQEREARLSALRDWSGHSDAEIITFAEAHQLPPTPDYGEWLVLLGRGDLIER
jgi:hypothetical protein